MARGRRRKGLRWHVQRARAVGRARRSQHDQISDADFKRLADPGEQPHGHQAAAGQADHGRGPAAQADAAHGAAEPHRLLPLPVRRGRPGDRDRASRSTPSPPTRPTSSASPSISTSWRTASCPTLLAMRRRERTRCSSSGARPAPTVPKPIRIAMVLADLVRAAPRLPLLDPGDRHLHRGAGPGEARHLSGRERWRRCRREMRRRYLMRAARPKPRGEVRDRAGAAPARAASPA